MIHITRRATFSASHRLHNPELSDEENAALFGACNHANGHGHNYEVEVVVRGEPDPRTGMVTNLTKLKQILHENVVSEAHHRSLDAAPFMKGRISSTENLAVAVWEAVAPHVDEGELWLVRVRESENNSVEYFGPSAT